MPPEAERFWILISHSMIILNVLSNHPKLGLDVLYLQCHLIRPHLGTTLWKESRPNWGQIIYQDGKSSKNQPLCRIEHLVYRKADVGEIWQQSSNILRTVPQTREWTYFTHKRVRPELREVSYSKAASQRLNEFFFIRIFKQKFDHVLSEML